MLSLSPLTHPFYFSALYEVHVCLIWNLCFNQATFCSPHCTQTEQGCQPVMLCNISHKSFNSSEQTLLIMAKWNENVDFRKRPGAIRSQMSIKCFGLWRRHGWVTGLFMKPLYSWNKIGFAKPARIFGTWTEIISPIISGKLTLVGSDWAWTKRSNVNWWSFFTVCKRSIGEQKH